MSTTSTMTATTEPDSSKSAAAPPVPQSNETLMSECKKMLPLPPVFGTSHSRKLHSAACRAMYATLEHDITMAHAVGTEQCLVVRRRDQEYIHNDALRFALRRVSVGV